MICLNSGSAIAIFEFPSDWNIEIETMENPTGI